MSVVITIRKLWLLALFTKYSLPVDGGLRLMICFGQRKSLKWPCTGTLPSCIYDTLMRRNLYPPHWDTWIAEVSPTVNRELCPGRHTAGNSATHLSQKSENYLNWAAETKCKSYCCMPLRFSNCHAAISR